MGKRKIKGSDFNHFGGENERNREDASYEETNAAFFGQFMDVEAVKTLRVEQIDIFKIRPDLRQPRRTIPSKLRRMWHGNPQEIAMLFEQWVALVNEDREANSYPPFNLHEALEMVENENPSPSAEHAKNYDEEHRMPRFWVTERGVRIDPRDLAKSGLAANTSGIRPHLLQTPNSAELKVELSKFSTEASLMHLVSLAASIREHGLTNPITISKEGNGYIIETGERRWMSFHLLHYVYGDEWGKIPARVVDKASVWRQASENNARQNLNAIAKARQLALLVMEMYEETGVKFDHIETFEHERDYYAQVADGQEWRIIKGETQKVMTMLGLQDASQIRQHRALLRMAPDLWDFADDNDISEYELREMIRMGLTPSSGGGAGISGKKASSSPEPEPHLFFQNWYKVAQQHRDLAKKMQADERLKMAVMFRHLADEIEKMK
ncbi:MAG: ParB N-terminal domain-containing protein [bacterium]|nr:ParB N-terminal domain-containing protein [bacterium]